MRSRTTTLGLSNSHWRATPPNARPARTSDRHNEWTVKSTTNSPHIAREFASTITNSHNARTPPGTAISPAWAQSTWATSPGNVSVARYASRGGLGLTSATCSRTVRTEPAKPRARTMSYSRVARSFGYR